MLAGIYSPFGADYPSSSTRFAKVRKSTGIPKKSKDFLRIPRISLEFPEFLGISLEFPGIREGEGEGMGVWGYEGLWGSPSGLITQVQARGWPRCSELLFIIGRMDPSRVGNA